jgi:hypothetical protein
MNNISEINQVTNITPFDKTRYEQIFKQYKLIIDENNNYSFFNILNKVIIPTDINSDLLGIITLQSKLPWTTLAFKIYKDINLWWLIHLINSPKNIFYAEAGIEYKYILPKYLNIVLKNIAEQVNT